MEKILNYTLGLGGAFPEEALCGGIQGENRATALVFEPDYELTAKLNEYKINGYTVETVIEAVTAAGECAQRTKQTGEELFSPFYLTDRVTLSGLDVVVVVRILIRSSEERELCKAQIKLYFTPSPIFREPATEKMSEVEELNQKAEQISKEFEEKAENIQNVIEQKLCEVKSAANLTAQQLKETKQIAEDAKNTRIALESGAQFVFTGGDAFKETSDGFVIDEELSEESVNPVSNKAVSEALNKVSTDYIVEQGTYGIWTYEKWASGIAKCWGIQNTTIPPANKAWPPKETGETKIYYSEAIIGADYPFVFAQNPICHFNIYENTNKGLIFTTYNQGSNRKENAPSTFAYSHVAFDDASEAEIHWDIKGRWK